MCVCGHQAIEHASGVGTCLVSRCQCGRLSGGVGCPDRMDRGAGQTEIPARHYGADSGADRGRPGHPRFHELLEAMRAMHVAKGGDYSRPEDTLSNLRVCEQMGIAPWLGVLVRLSDKFERIKNLARKAQVGEAATVADERIEDTLLDAAAYCLLAIIIRGEAK